MLSNVFGVILERVPGLKRTPGQARAWGPTPGPRAALGLGLLTLRFSAADVSC